MAKDFWMNGVQVKIWKGKVEGERTLLLCGASLLAPAGAGTAGL